MAAKLASTPPSFFFNTKQITKRNFFNTDYHYSFQGTFKFVYMFAYSIVCSPDQVLSSGETALFILVWDSFSKTLPGKHPQNTIILPSCRKTKYLDIQAACPPRNFRKPTQKTRAAPHPTDCQPAASTLPLCRKGTSRLSCLWLHVLWWFSQVSLQAPWKHLL